MPGGKCDPLVPFVQYCFVLRQKEKWGVSVGHYFCFLLLFLLSSFSIFAFSVRFVVSSSRRQWWGWNKAPMVECLEGMCRLKCRRSAKKRRARGSTPHLPLPTSWRTHDALCVQVEYEGTGNMSNFLANQLLIFRIRISYLISVKKPIISYE